ncbi:MAG: hypothetical protein J3Q66DRAFT_360193 [Benniella sp.]|nr:MAG: hypothetical protein J3Q66DRAFT_360193 [Benniella sp.]
MHLREQPPCGSARRLASVALLGLLFLAVTPARAQPAPVLQTCAESGCKTVVSILEPCGGGATDSSLQHSLTYTVTPALGSCQCNTQFYDAFSQCLGCVALQGQSSPSIDTQQNWIDNCKTYGFDFTMAPVNVTAPTGGDDSGSGKKGGITAGGVVGIVIAALTAIAALTGGFILYRNKHKRSKGSIFKRPTYTAAGTDEYNPSGAQPSFNAYTNYQNDAHPESYGGYTDNDQSYYDHQYGSQQNDDTLMMSNLKHSSYIAPPAPMSSEAVAAVSHLNLGSPRPGDQYPQSLRSKHNDWESRQHDYNADLTSADHLLHNDKAVYDEGEELEPPRARERFVNDRDDLSTRRSLTPPRSANLQSYRDEFTRPSFERETGRDSPDRGSVTGMNMVRGAGGVPRRGGYDSHDDEGDREDAENIRRLRAAELFSAEGSRR